MLELFETPWEDLDADGVRDFLESAGEEGVTWEAKAGDEKGRLHPDSLRKAVCGLANRIGGYVLVGAKWNKAEKRWELPGITPPDEEPELWIGKVVRGLTPAPRFEPKAWTLDDGRVVAVVWVEPVDEPACMTPKGAVFERVSGETLPVTDPARLDALFRGGQQARERAEQFADRAAARALDAPGWQSERTVAISVALAPIGRETDDISSRLFVPSFREFIVKALWDYFTAGFGLGIVNFSPQPDDIRASPEQDALTIRAHFSEGRVLRSDRSVQHQSRSTWLLQATWDGAVAAGAIFSESAVDMLSGFDQVVMPGWQQIVPLVQRLGGYGPAQLTVGLYAAQDRSNDPVTKLQVEHGMEPPPAPTPPNHTLYAKLQRERERETWIRRWVNVDEPDAAMLGSIQREVQRAAGIESHEPEPPPEA
jgi:hypothetical protein